MPLSTVLHIPTLLLFGQLMLLLIGGALLTVRPLPGQKSRVLSVWVIAMAALVLPVLFEMLRRALQLAADSVMHSAVAGFMTASAGWRCMALRMIRQPPLSWWVIAAGGLAAGAAGALLVMGLPDGMRNVVIGVANCLVPVLMLPVLLPLARENAGGAMTAVGVVLSAVPSACNLLGVISPDRGDTSLLILGDLIAHFASGLGLLLWHQGRIHQLLAQAAISDALTGALNRHGLMPQLERELARAERGKRPLSVVLCDLDHFKRVNDTHGHAVGDQVLQHFVARAAGALRKGDILGRWGGEEFLFVLPDTATRDAVLTLERLRQPSFPPPPGVPLVTFSAGVATVDEGSRCSVTELLNSADRRLYIAKETRDRVVSSLTPVTQTQEPANGCVPLAGSWF